MSDPSNAWSSSQSALSSSTKSKLECSFFKAGVTRSGSDSAGDGKGVARGASCGTAGGTLTGRDILLEVVGRESAAGYVPFSKSEYDVDWRGVPLFESERHDGPHSEAAEAREPTDSCLERR